MSSRAPWFLGVAAVAALVLALAHARGLLEPAERSFYDSFLASRPVDPEAARASGVIVVEVTDDCVERFGPWPWRRSLVAELIENLAAAGPRAIAVDLLFLDPDPLEDPRLVKVLEAAGNVVLASEVVRRTSWDNEAGGLTSRLEVARPPEPLAKAAARLGFVNVDYFHDNQDGVVRKLPLSARVAGEDHAVLALAAVAEAGSRPLDYDAAGRVLLGGELVPSDAPRDTHERPVGARRDLLEVQFPSSAYVGYRPDTAHGGLPILRAMDILQGGVPRLRFKESVVFLGINARGMDRKITPVGSWAGVEVQAQMAADLLTGSLPRRMAPGSTRALAVLLLLGGVLGLGGLGFLRGALLLVLVGGAWAGWSHRSFMTSGWYLDLVTPLVGLGVGGIAGALTRLSLDVRDHIRRLSALHESSRRFSRTLEIVTLEDEVRARYRELLGGPPPALSFRAGEGEPFRFSGGEVLPEALRPLLARAKVQEELCQLLRVPDAVVSGARLREVPGVARDIDVPPEWRILPLGRFEKATGFLLAPDPWHELDVTGDAGRFWVTHAHLTATALENAGLYELATVDALTGLFIRHYFDVSLARELSRVGRHHGALALLLTDVDHFKKFNDTHGHQVGDEVLRFVAEKVRETVRDLDIPCRYGGEEFAVILPDTDVEGARLTAERIRHTIETSSVLVGVKELGVTISIGLACVGAEDGRPTPEQFVEAADTALYQAKDKGRNRVEVARAFAERSKE